MKKVFICFTCFFGFSPHGLLCDDDHTWENKRHISDSANSKTTDI